MKEILQKMKQYVLFLLLVLIGNHGWGQTSINFDTASNWIQGGAAFTSYSNHSYSESGVTFQGTKVLRNTTTLQDGFAGAIGTYSFRLENTTNGILLITIGDGGLSNFSFKVRRWDNSPAADYTVKYTINGGIDWISLSNVNSTLLTTSDWFTFSSGTINSTASNIQIEIKNTGTTERIMFDDFTWTGYSAPTNSAPTASLVLFSGTTAVGQTLTGTYSYADADSDLEGTSIFQWYRADDASGTNSAAISGATASTYLLQAADSGNYIRFGVIPLATSGISPGFESFSDWFGPVTSPISGSSASTIIENTNYNLTSNINYSLYQEVSTLSTSNSIEVGKFEILDGGGISDSDALSTTLNSITFSVANFNNIKAIALFDDTTNISEITTVGSIATFTGLNLTAVDGGSKTFSIRATFNSSVTDNQQLLFTVIGATADNSGSIFAAADAGGALTTTSGDANRIEVIGTSLFFGVQPTNVIINTVMSPSVTVLVKDDYSNLDLDYTGGITLTSTGTFSGDAITTVNASGGVATFNNLKFSQLGSSKALSGSAIGLTSTSNSDLFSISVQPAGILLLEDNFEAVNQLLTNNNWIQIGTTSTNAIPTGNNNGLTYSSYGSSNIGNSAIINNSGQDIYKTFTSQNPGGGSLTLYFSALVSLSSVKTTGDYFLCLGESSTFSGSSVYRARVYAKQGSTASKVLFGISTTNGTIAYSTTEYSIDSSILLAVKYEFTTTTSTCSLYINPSTTSMPVSPDVTESTASSVTIGLDAIVLRQGNSLNAPTLVIDGLRIATNWGALMGNPKYSDNTIIAAGNYNSITTYDGATPSISGNVNVYDELSILGGTLTTNNTLTLKSNTNGTARVSEVGSGASITGNITVERYVPAKRGWRILTSPLKGNANTTIPANWQGVNDEGLLLFSPSTYQSQTMTGYTTGGGMPNIWKYDSANSQWQSIPDLTNENLFTSTGNNGYLVFATGPSNSTNIASGSAETTLRPEGQLITGNVSHSLTANQYHLIGNPYASALDTEALVQANANTKVFMVDPSLSTVGGYVTYDGTNWAPTAPSGSDKYIQSGQGFFVRSSSNTTFAITESDKVMGNSNTWFSRTSSSSNASSNVDADKIRVLLYKQINGQWQLADGILTVNSATGNNDVDATDTEKMSNFNENIGFRNGTSTLAIEYRGLPTMGTVQPMRLTGTTVQPYQMRVTTENYSNSDLQPYLEDTQTGVLTLIPTDGSEVVVNFTGIAATTSAPDSRFRIVYPVTLSSDDPTASLSVGIYPNPVEDKMFTIVLPNQDETTQYTLTNLLGQQVQQGKLDMLQNSVSVASLQAGVYVVQVVQSGKTFTTKLIIK